MVDRVKSEARIAAEKRVKEASEKGIRPRTQATRRVSPESSTQAIAGRVRQRTAQPAAATRGRGDGGRARPGRIVSANLDRRSGADFPPVVKPFDERQDVIDTGIAAASLIPGPQQPVAQGLRGIRAGSQGASILSRLFRRRKPSPPPVSQDPTTRALQEGFDNARLAREQRGGSGLFGTDTIPRAANQRTVRERFPGPGGNRRGITDDPNDFASQAEAIDQRLVGARAAQGNRVQPGTEIRNPNAQRAQRAAQRIRQDDELRGAAERTGRNPQVELAEAIGFENARRDSLQGAFASRGVSNVDEGIQRAVRSENTLRSLEAGRRGTSSPVVTNQNSIVQNAPNQETARITNQLAQTERPRRIRRLPSDQQAELAKEIRDTQTRQQTRQAQANVLRSSGDAAESGVRASVISDARERRRQRQRERDLEQLRQQGLL